MTQTPSNKADKNRGEEAMITQYTQPPSPLSSAQIWQASLTLAFVYIIFALVLNSVGIVILQSINYFGVNKTEASILEAFKDLPIAVISFFAASSLPYFGYRRALLLSLALVFIAASAMLLGDAFWAAKLFFLLSGVAFGLAKVAVYASIGLLSKSREAHASLMNFIEGFFMIGVLSGFWIFSFFIAPNDPYSASWLQFYWFLGALCLAAMLAVFFLRLPENAVPIKTEKTQATPLAKELSNDKISANTAPKSGSVINSGTAINSGSGAKPTLRADFIQMLRLAYQKSVLIFIAAIYLYVMIEQGIGSWLPTFNREMLTLSAQLSVQAASIFALSQAIGRLSAGFLLRFLRWDYFLSLCLIAMALLMLLVLPLAASLSDGALVTRWSEAPLAVFLLPLMGFFMGPIYPALTSFILSSLPTARQASMTGLIVVFSALGGTSGSLVIGYLFEHYDGQTAFYLLLLPVTCLFVAILALRRASHKAK